MKNAGSARRFTDAIHLNRTDRPPVAPKIWLDWTAAHGYMSAADALSQPEAAMLGVIRASMDMGFDAARVFLMPRRIVRSENGRLMHIAQDGRVLGEVDLAGGWATLMQRPEDFDLTNPSVAMNVQSYSARTAPVQSMEDIEKIIVPAAEWYEEQGYGEMLEKAMALAGDKIALLGDCNTGTLSFYIAVRGMMDAMMDLIDDPEMVHACMDKGISISLERARFFLKHGIRVLRYNDSSANMKLISADMWRTFIAPHMTRFCREVHRMDPEAKVYCHICGDIRPILPDLVQTGLDCIAPLDPLGGCPVEGIRALTGDKIALMGGVNTLTLLQGAPEDVRRETSECISGGGRGYIIGSGCAVARDTPPENLQAMIEAAACAD